MTDFNVLKIRERKVICDLFKLFFGGRGLFANTFFSGIPIPRQKSLKEECGS